MTIECHLVPDGADSLPVEGRDHGKLGDKIHKADPPDHTPAPSVEDFEQTVRTDRIIIRVLGASLDDYADGALDEYATATAEINGLKVSDAGWIELKD